MVAAVHFRQTALRTDKPLSQVAATEFPTHCIPANLKRYLYISDRRGRKCLLPEFYEFPMYLLLR